MDIAGLRCLLKKHQQEHLLQFWDTLSNEEQELLYKDIRAIDFEDVLQTFHESTGADKKHGAIDDDLLEPLTSDVHESITSASSECVDAYRSEGLKEIAEGRVAALLLAGGQGTRLGVDYPKGMYNVGLPSNKTLYQLQGERIKRLQDLSYEHTGKRGYIPWYIMTSAATKQKTLDFFATHDYFGLREQDIVLFEQGRLPCFTFDGKVILDKPHRVARAPDGNGGLYSSLRVSGVLEDLKKRGVASVHVYCVDNILVKIADPIFIGYCTIKGARAGAKVVEKTVPTEAVGIICKVQGKYQVVEYSEVSSNIAERRDKDGRLTFNAGNICNHFFTVDFLDEVTRKRLQHHVAQKKIPFTGATGTVVKPLKPNGIKLEKFVFDVFEFTDKFVVWEVLRNEEFSPLKNANEAGKDTPITARNSLYEQHRKYIIKAGGTFKNFENGNDMDGKNQENVQICEISPLLSYDGEGLEKLVQGKELYFPLILYTEEELREVNIDSPKNGH